MIGNKKGIAALVSNGPGARLFPGNPIIHKTGERLFDTVIAVNWVVNWLPLTKKDWWAFVDISTFANPEKSEIAIGSYPGIATRRANIEKIKSGTARTNPRSWEVFKCAEKENRIIRYEDYKIKPSQDEARLPDRWNRWSGAIPFVLAYRLGYRKVVLYGYDLKGAIDHIGRKGASRNEARWKRERRVFAFIAKWYGLRGMEITRVYDADFSYTFSQHTTS